jgi:hypothetical protein
VDAGASVVEGDASEPQADAGTSVDAGAAMVVDAGPLAPVSWPSGTDGLDPTFVESFGGWRGLAATSSWINVHFIPWDWLTMPGLLSSVTGKETVKVWDLVEGWPGIAVLSASMAGIDEMTQEEYDAALVQCANGEFDDEWRTFASNATMAGRTGKNTVISLAHEFNGNWFRWNPGTVGLQTWTSCWRKVYTAIKSASDIQVIWVFSATANNKKVAEYTVDSAWEAYPGDAYVDIIGVNRYDFRSLSGPDETDWRTLCKNTQDICYAADFARKHNKKLGIPEWSVERGEYGYGDNPSFIDLMRRFFADNADILAFENNFNNGGLGEWHLYPPSPDNVNSAERYKQLWKAP